MNGSSRPIGWPRRREARTLQSMKHRPIVSVLIAVLLSSAAAGCSPADPTSFGAAAAPQANGAEAALRVLFIGNSYTFYNNLPGMVQQLAAAGSRPVEAHMVAYGGATLEVHWTRGDGPGRILGEQWDYVVLQEQSTRPIGNREAFFQYARLFDEAIRGRGAETVFYMTWARQNEPQNQAALTSAYETIARELGAKVAPVGRAWEAANGERPALDLFDADGSHPNPTGSYLGACVFYATLLGADPSGSSAAIRDPETGAQLVALDTNAAARLQSIAWDAARR